MQTKNRKIFLTLFFLSFFIFNLNLSAEEFNITAKEIFIDKENQIIVGKGSVQAIDSVGKIINANKITYEKFREFLLAEGNVKIADVEGNVLTTDKATYDKINEIITTHGNTELILKEGYKLIAKNILYNTEKKMLFATNRGSLSSLKPKFFGSKITLTSEPIISFLAVST